MLINNSWSYGGNDLKLDELFARPKSLVPASGDPNGLEEPIPINQIINHCGLWECHYLLEFSPVNDLSNNISNLLSKKELSKVCKIINEKIYFDFNYLSDKIGSIIFEYKCSIVNYSPIQLNRDYGIILNLTFHQKLMKKNEYLLQVIREFDGLISHFEARKNFSAELVKIEPNDEINKLLIIDLEKNLIVFMFQIDLRYKDDYVNCILPTNFITSVSQNFRTILDKDNIERRIPLSTSEALGGGEFSDNSATMTRQYSNSIQQLTNQKLLLAYHGNEHERAIDDLKYIINNKSLRFDLEEICLWDPYLLSNDILETAYFCPKPSLKIRAITSLRKGNEDEENTDEDIKTRMTNQKKWLENHTNNIGITLEFRCQYNQFGWGFHDRFLIITHFINRPRVWSLGTSFNSVGKKHHIVQAVQNPQVIVDAFNDLWNVLPKEECLIYKSKTEG